MIKIITAMTKSGIIGKGNELPWNIHDELKHFRRTTQGHTVIMGSKTFDSIGRPLPNRNNIVLCAEKRTIDGVAVCHSVEEALEKAQSYNYDIFVIGGAYTYAQFLDLADEMYISYIKQDYPGNVFFPQVDWSLWKEKSREDFSEFEFIVYERKNT